MRKLSTPLFIWFLVAVVVWALWQTLFSYVIFPAVANAIGSNEVVFGVLNMIGTLLLGAWVALLAAAMSAWSAERVALAAGLGAQQVAPAYPQSAAPAYAPAAPTATPPQPPYGA